MIQELDLRPVQNALWNILAQAVFTTTGSAYTGAFGSSYIGLFIAPYPGFSLGLQMSQIVEPGYTGYARQRATWTTQGIDGVGRPQVFAQQMDFQPTGAGSNYTVLGAFIATLAAAGGLLAVGLLPNPVNIGLVTDQIAVVARLAMPLDPANWGAGTVMN